MSFLRPEAVATLRRVAEPALWGLATGWFLWRAWLAAASAPWIAAVFAALALASGFGAFAAIQRALLARGGGTGMVVVEEGRITYLGPFGGAAIAIDLMVSVGIESPGDGHSPPLWDLRDEEGRRLLIPVGAAGAERLADALAQLPGYDQMAVVRALRSSEASYHAVWRRRAPVASLGRD